MKRNFDLNAYHRKGGAWLKVPLIEAMLYMDFISK